MKNFYTKSFTVVIALLISMSMYSQLVVSPATLEFGDREKGYFLTKLAYEVTNNGTDTAFISYAHSASAFVNENVWVKIAPGQTVSNWVKLDRSFDAGQYNETLYLETNLGNANVEVSANIIDNTPTITFNDIYYWVGSGSNRAILEFDFNDGLEKEAIAFGYKFTGTVTAEQLITDVAAAFPQLTVDMTGGFLSSVTFDDHSGIGGSPDYWMTLSRPSNSLWEINWGLTTIVDNGEWFGCAYTGTDADFNPLNLPGNPSWAGYPLSMSEINESNFDVYPNPSTENICITTEALEINTIEVIDISGKVVKSFNPESGTNKSWINIADLSNGIYQIKITTPNSIESSRIIKN